MAVRQRSATNLFTAAAAAGGGLAFAWASGSGAGMAGGLPVLLVCALAAYAINWIAFVPAALFQRETFYDLTGAITYVSVVAIACLLSAPLDLRAGLAAGMVVIWALRLGAFLFLRIRAAGSDGRFDAIKRDPARFLVVWTVQGLWVVMTAGAALAVIAGPQRAGRDGWLVGGALVWLAGMVIEVVADAQKSAFRREPRNQGRFITTGLWGWSQHPNYFGEIVLWAGLALIAVPVLSGWGWLVLVSPLFVWVLLTRISGIPLLVARAEARWGDDPAFRAYRASTPLLVPRLRW
ncbi:MAG TPA: DUF1295 domain-containing protein [Novosphingobium sp.]|nr:DUF1295 domain-containing protein [Novosphingobium sp.]